MSEANGGKRGAFSGFESVPIDVTVRVGRARCQLQRLSQLQAGELIHLDREIGQPFELCSGGVLLARVEPVADGDGIAVKIVKIAEEDDDSGC